MIDVSGKKFLVTGGAGFIGSHVVDALLAGGARVVVLDDFSSGEQSSLAHHANNPSLFVVEADIRDEAAIAPAFTGVDTVLHLACRNVRLSLNRPTEVHETNSTGTLNVLKASAAAGVTRFLYCSSSEVNGTADVVPMPELYHYAPETIYGASKLTGEYYTQVFHRAGWLSTVIARPHNNYGPREHYKGHHGEVIPRFIIWALAGKSPLIYGDGLQTRDFTYVTETADYLIRLALSDAAAGGVYNVCRGQEVSIKEIATIIADLTSTKIAPKHLPGRPSDVLRLLGDPTRLKDVLGDSPRIDIRDGLQRTFAWFEKNVVVTESLLASMAPENWNTTEPEAWLDTMNKREEQ